MVIVKNYEYKPQEGILRFFYGNVESLSVWSEVRRKA